ncbi:GDSL-type esterase/lipase family protein [Enterobacter bugandensis]|uniref:GDSL-type esterase/lipase family protein n=1 Tax=Enterobacter bugandensis TaxID=881260 RepID=UPI0032AEB15A
MTVSTVVDHNDYTGNGVTTSFPYTFRIFKKTDLTVSVINLDETISVLVLDTDYTVSNAGGYNGGNVVLTSPLASGWQISIARDLEPTQETDLRNQGKFFAEVHEDAFDKLTMLIQQVGSLFRLALRKPSSIANWYDALNNYIRNVKDPRDAQDAATKNYVDTLSGSNNSRTLRTPEPIPQLPAAASRANKIIGFDGSGNPVMLVPESGSASDVLLLLLADDGYKRIPSIFRVNSDVPVEMFRTAGMTDQQVVQAANDYAASVGRRLIFEAGLTYQVVTLNCTCEWSGPATIKRQAGVSSTLINMASGARITGKMTIDGNSANCTGSASNVVMNGVSGCVLDDFSSINACGHNIEINNSVYSDTRLPNKVKNGVVNGAAIGHAISLYNAANEVLDGLELINGGDGLNASGSTRSIRPLLISKVNARKNRNNGFAVNFISTADTPVYDMVKFSDCFARDNGVNGFAIQSHYTTLTNCHAYKNGTTKDHQGFLFNANGVTFSSLIAFQNKGVGFDFGDCRKCAGSGLFAESSGWHGLEINSCEDMAISGVVLNDSFKGQVDGALQAGLIIHKGNGGYPFPGDSKNISLSAVTIGSGEGQRYGLYVDADSYNVVVNGVNAKNAALLEDIFTASPNVIITGNTTRWDPLGDARGTLSGGYIHIPSVANTVSVNGSGSCVNIAIGNGGAFVKDRTVRIKAVSGFTLENSGGTPGGNLYLGASVVLTAGQSILLYSDGSGGWVKYNALSNSSGGIINNVAVFGDSTVDGYGTTPWVQNPLTPNHYHNSESPMAWVSMLDGIVGKRVFNNGYSGKSIIDDWAISNITNLVFNNSTNINIKYVMLVFGLNDIGQSNWSTSLYSSKYTELINFVKNQGLIPIVVTSDPISNVNDTFVQNTLVPLQRQIATNNSVQCLDLNAGLVSWSDYRSNQPDQIHFNNTGNAKKRDLAQTFVQSLP